LDAFARVFAISGCAKADRRRNQIVVAGGA